MTLEHFFDAKTNTLTYLVYTKEGKDCLVIDPVWDFDYASGRLSTHNIDKVIARINDKKLNLVYILETHVHADHISASHLLKKTFPKAQTCISENIKMVQKTFSDLFNFKNFKSDGSQFDRLLKDGDSLDFSDSKIKVIATPGHTPACISYLIDGHLFTGDALFMPDFGTGRCDFPGGDAMALFHSISHKIYALPDDTRIFVGHDYMPGGRELKFETSVRESKDQNKHIKENTKVEEFLDFRLKRDKELGAPNLIYPSLQININAGELLAAEDNGKNYLKIPLKIMPS